MSKIHSITIRNFRGIHELSHSFDRSDFICLIGRGDGGKSTLLEAISYALSPQWNLSINDTDFHNCNLNIPIEIEVSLSDLPIELLKEDKFGLYIRGLDLNDNSIHDEIGDDHEKIITIKLIIEKDLEPHWLVINERQPPKPISANDRSRFNVFLVSDYVDRHFSWNKGNPLYALLKQEESEESEDENVILDALREAKGTIDGYPFSQFDKVTEKIKSSASILGVNISNTSTSIDFKDLFIKDGKVSLHGDKVPFRLKGKGTKRLISMAIQTSLAEAGGIILIDEIEQGLEPDRVQHLVSTLKKNNAGQVFITTHSRDVIVELETDDLLLMRSSPSKLVEFNSSLQGCLRKNPEAFFARKIILCEGATEIGLCRALNNYKIIKGHQNAAYSGVRFTNGGGSEMLNYLEGFVKSGFEVCLLCDSDEKAVNIKKGKLKESGRKIIDCEADEYLELLIIKNLPLEAVSELLELAKTFMKEPGDLWSSVKLKFGAGAPENFTLETDTSQLRTAISAAAQKGSWFKSQTKGEALGDLIFKYIDKIEANRLKSNLNELSVWIDGNGL